MLEEWLGVRDFFLTSIFFILNNHYIESFSIKKITYLVKSTSTPVFLCLLGLM